MLTCSHYLYPCLARAQVRDWWIGKLILSWVRLR